MNTEDGSTTEQIYKRRNKKVKGHTEINLVYKNIVLGTKIYTFNSFLFLEDSMEKMHNLVSFLK